MVVVIDVTEIQRQVVQERSQNCLFQGHWNNTVPLTGIYYHQDLPNQPYPTIQEEPGVYSKKGDIFYI